jgi:hypothetical protein
MEALAREREEREARTDEFRGRFVTGRVGIR